jgi:hypothetical protein
MFLTVPLPTDWNRFKRSVESFANKPWGSLNVFASGVEGEQMIHVANEDSFYLAGSVATGAILSVYITKRANESDPMTERRGSGFGGMLFSGDGPFKTGRDTPGSDASSIADMYEGFTSSLERVDLIHLIS